MLNNLELKETTFKVGYGSEITETKKLNITIEILHPENRPLLVTKHLAI